MSEHRHTPAPGAHAAPDAPAAPPPVCVVVSRYNDSITGRLRDGALRAYQGRHPGAPGPVVVDAPGTFELPAIASAAVESGRFEAVVALGCVVRGETDHDRYISQAVASALAMISAQAVVPIAFGVLTVNTPEQAEARAGGPDGTGPGNKGEEAMLAALESIDAMRHLLEFDDHTAGFRLDRVAQDKVRAGGAAGGPIGDGGML